MPAPVMGYEIQGQDQSVLTRGISCRVFIARSQPIRCASCSTVNSAVPACNSMAWFHFESCTSRKLWMGHGWILVAAALLVASPS